MRDVKDEKGFASWNLFEDGFDLPVDGSGFV